MRGISIRCKPQRVRKQRIQPEPSGEVRGDRSEQKTDGRKLVQSKGTVSLSFRRSVVDGQEPDIPKLDRIGMILEVKRSRGARIAAESGPGVVDGNRDIVLN